MVSIKTMIAKIIRDTRLKDSAYADDMLEWIPSAMGELETTWTLSHSSALVKVVFHKAPLPCGVESITSVVYGTNRMRFATPDYDVSYHKTPTSSFTGDSVFLSRNKTVENVQDMEISTPADSSYSQSQLFNASSLPYCHHWYRDLPECIETSLEKGMIRVNYLGIPVDTDGYPLIPDNENYKEAIYYKVRMKLIEAGYPDPTMKWEICMQLFEKYAGRAMGEIRYPSPDRMESMHRTLTRLIPPPTYYQDFGLSTHDEHYPHPS